MELVLDEVLGVPRDAILSLKIGEVRRQAPTSKIGQSFRFSSSPAEALPMKVEVFVPAAAPKAVMLDPLQQSFVINLAGNMQIKMRQRAVEDYQRPVPDVGQIAASRGLDKDKKDVAASAGAYLEKHGMVRVFQDLLHGLLVLRPEDPWGYLDEHLARAKAVAGAQPQGQDQKQQQPKAGKSKSAQRGSITSSNKIDALMDILVKTQQNLPLILPYLPEELRDMLTSEELTEECKRQFLELDTRGKGSLSADCLTPVIVQLSTANHHSVGPDQCKKFMSVFDANEDGEICLDEFTSLTQFVIIAAHLETDDGKTLLQEAQSEEVRFNDFMDILIADKDRINDIVPFLPDYLVQHLTSDNFLDECMDNFDQLDTDRNGSLCPDELVPLVLSLTRMQSNVLTDDKCKQFVDVFDVRKNGVIMRDEFLEFAQFLAVMSFLKTSSEGAQINEVAMYTEEMKKTQVLIDALQEDISVLPQVLSYLPKSITAEIQSDGFKIECKRGFQKLDKDGNQVLDPVELFPIIIQLCHGHPGEIDLAACKKFTAIFDKDRNGVISINEFATLCQFIITMGYLQFTQDWRDSSVKHSHQKIETLLQIMTEHCERLDEILPLLPFEMQDDLMSSAFQTECMEYFDNVDTDGSGSLEPKELIPIILDLCKAHPFALTRDQCLRFVDIFDTERTGVLSRNEFTNFARFMMIMSYLETEDGQEVQAYVEIVKSDSKLDEVLRMLEHDRQAMHKIIPMLPKAMYEALINDEFVKMCHQKFEELDADKNGVLSPKELYPLVAELSGALPYSIDEEQCERFTAIFDIRGDGVIRIDEFLDFARFLEIQAYVQSAEGQKQFGEGLQILEDSKRIEDLIATLEQDRNDIQSVIPFLPDDIRDELLSEQFTLSCLERFGQLDVDNSGSLDPTELFPIILDMTNAHHLAVDLEQMSRFTAIFDDAQTGVISQKEFVNFARFLMVMSYLQTSDGQTVLEIAMQEQAVASPSMSGTQQALALPPPPGMPPSPQAVNHLSVDLDHYQQKADKLKRENDEQRKRMQSMEQKMREMEERMELQDRKLRHAAVDLNATPQRR